MIFRALLIFAAFALPCAADDEADAIGNDEGQPHVQLLQQRFTLSSAGDWDVSSQIAPAHELEIPQEQSEPDRHSLLPLAKYSNYTDADVKMKFDNDAKIDNSSLQLFRALPEVHSSCLSSKKGCTPKVAFMFLTIRTISQPAAWDAFFAKAPPDSFSIYVERKERDGDLPLVHFGAIEAEPVETDWCALLGGMMSLLWAAFSDAQNQQFVFVSDDSIPLKSFGYVYASLVQKAPESSNFCAINGPVMDPTTPVAERSPESLAKLQAGKICAMGDGWHATEERLFKAHQWSTLTRDHTELILRHMNEAFELFAVYHPMITNGCSDEVVPISALVAGLRVKGFPVEGNWDDLAQWNVTNRCPVLAAWPGPANCSTPPRPSDSGLVDYSGPYCPDGFCEPYQFRSMQLQHLRNLIRSGFMFARRFTNNTEVINGTEHVALSQVVLPDLWMEAEGGPFD